MMLLCFILTLLTVICRNIHADNELHDMRQYVKFLQQDESRFLGIHNYTEGDKCAITCFRKSRIPAPVRDFFIKVYRDVFKRENSTNIRRLFNATMLDWYCGYANDRQDCVLNCSDDGVVKVEILKLMRPTSYICNETEFIENSKCYQKVYEEDLDECESGEKCLNHKLTMIDLFYRKPYPNISIGERTELLFSNLCQYIICGNQCRLRELMQNCGADSNEILIEFYRRLVSSLKQIVTELVRYFMGKELVIVDTCDQI